MNLKLTRDVLHEDCTGGRIFNGDEFICFSLEDTVREISLPVERWKIPGQTAIPRGTYQVMITFSNRFQKYLPELQDVPGFTGIRIHSGNTSEDTSGCVLVGTGRGERFLSGSRAALTLIQGKIEDAIRNGDKVFIEIE